MRHLTEGKLHAHCDGELSSDEVGAIEAHLSVCPRCEALAATVAERAERVDGLIATLQPAQILQSSSTKQARGRFDVYRQRREEERMDRNPFSRRYRPAWGLAALVLVLAVALTFAPVRSLASDLLSIFRVESIQFATLDTETLPDEERLEALAPEIERVFGDALAVAAEGEPQEVTEAEARDVASFPIRLPDTAEANGHQWTPAGTIEMTIDVDELQTLFHELGYTDLELPATLDGTTLTAELSGALTSYYGDCKEADAEGCVKLVQMASPSVSVPDGLDVQELGRIYLELLGTPVEEAAALSRRIDWTTTLVLPFPHHVNLTHEEIAVDGVAGTLIHSESSYRTREYLLTWVKDGVIYALAGRGEHADALQLAASLQ